MTIIYKFAAMFTFIFVVFIQGVFAQQSNEWVNLTTGFDVKCIVEENDYIWIGTNGGLVKIHKSTHQKTFFNKANSGLPDIYINDICIDNNGGKWIATKQGGLAYYDNQTWTVFNSYNSIIAFNDIQDVCVDNLNNVWIASLHKIYKYTNGILELYETNPVIGNFNNFRKIQFDKNNIMWFCTYTNIFKIISATNVIEYSSTNFGIPAYNLTDFDIDNDNVLWIGSNFGLIRFDGINHELFNMGNSPLPSDKITSVNVIENEILLSTDLGLVNYNNQNWILYDTSNSEIISNKINCAVRDSDDNMWIGTENEGLVKASDSGWQQINTSNSVLRHSNIFNMVIDKTGVIWFATFDGLVSLDGDYWTLYNKNNSPLPDNYVRDIVVDDNNNKFIATQKGLAKFNNVTWTIYNTENSNLPSNKIKKLHICENAFVWLGLEDKGLVRYDGEHWINFNTSNSGLPNNNINTINSSDSIIWIGTSSGLTKLKHFNWTTYNHSNSNLQHNNVTSITKGLNGSLIVGILYGPRVFNDGIFSLLDTSALMFNCNGVLSVDFDRDSSLLICTGKGLFVYKETLVKHYHFFNSPITSFYVSRVLRDEYNNLWLPTICGGIVVYNENGVVLNTSKHSDTYKVENETFLYQNYPNPFVSSTTIAFDLPEAAYVHLQVFNANGKMVAQPIAKSLAKGFHSIQFSLENMPNGVYFYSLKTKNYSLSKRMVLMK